MENFNELISLNKQVKAVRLQDKRVKQIFDQDLKKVFEPMTDIVKNVSNDITKSVTENFIQNNNILVNLNEKVSELMNDKSMTAPYLASSLVIFLKIGNKTLYKVIKDYNSIRMKDFLINGGITVTL